ncbi:MAG TPA: hypothetical protein DIW23_12060 [Anaerolineae bacterium]|nr:hypothetical protein [Anaerolineae bacterium]
MYEYKTTWTKGMNTRPNHNVNNAPNGTVAYGETVKGVELWTATADGSNVKKGDQWVRLESNVTKWVAVIHMGTVYGIVKLIGENPEPEPDPEPTPVELYPDFMIGPVDKTGQPLAPAKRYRVVEE